MLALGIDSGTQSTKAVVLDTETGKIVASAQRGYGLIPDLRPGHKEQDPQTWVNAADSAVRECVALLGDRTGDLQAIGISGQQHGLVVLDRTNKPVRPAKLWCDTSTTDQCARFEAEFGGASGLIELAGNAMLPGYTAPKILWLKENEPQNFERANCFLLPHDFLNFWLTAEKRMEYGDASGTGLMDVRTRRWCKPLVDFIDPGLGEYMPEPESSRAATGLLRESLREQWGLKSSPIVSAGGGDNMMGAIGTGNIAPGIVTASLGTSGTLYSFAESPVIDPQGEIAAFCDSTDGWLPLVCTMNVTVATEQVRRMFAWDHTAFEHAVASVPAGADGLVFLPYLNGERTPNLPQGTGVLHGLTTENMHPAHFARAVVEGVTLGLAYGLQRFAELGIQPKEIRLTGGGSRSAVWRQICADVFGVPTVSLRSSEGAALGAAVQAAWTHGSVNGNGTAFRELTRRLIEIDPESRCEPNRKLRELHSAQLQRFTDLTSRLHAARLL
jgi:xylulokinase